ncbi:diversity-generating retroelement protein Avd [candidate division KSB1 bacterium]|nr:diversity-generating retroelement protein Avd [candidate division KSB1 bacterium]MCH8021448.1 diversity-generating retroelement protein Avd [candidate division KSB1 bacterium]MCH8954400.1 diversity-generating retroelement protein Avd [candidate division KSB1 bacterium]
MANQDLLVIKKGYDFSKWLLQHTGKFPKSYRFSVAAKLENAILDFIEFATVANMRKDKVPLLRKADEALARLRLLFRLSYELRFVNLKSYEFGSKQVNELGRLLGGWIKKPGANPAR